MLPQNNLPGQGRYHVLDPHFFAPLPTGMQMSENWQFQFPEAIPEWDLLHLAVVVHFDVCGNLPWLCQDTMVLLHIPAPHSRRDSNLSQSPLWHHQAPALLSPSPRYLSVMFSSR